jgi:AraC-like DNA-binding protein
VALFIFFLGLFALFGAREYITAQDLSTLIRFSSSRESQPKLADEGELAVTPSISAALFGNARNWEDGSLVTRFQHLMQDEELFLQPGLTLGDVATRLDSNKTYISKMVNQTYGVGFPELLNIMRVDYAELYIRKDASQEEIAKASGFLSASSFNSTFKRITGYTPKVWASRKA